MGNVKSLKRLRSISLKRGVAGSIILLPETFGYMIGTANGLSDCKAGIRLKTIGTFRLSSRDSGYRQIPAVTVMDALACEFELTARLIKFWR